ncbi:MAG: GNAT family N-acetyltransferase [Planctomycetota bacterium]|nr:GNAT family N-acetyltransferase [Planctomycetota bacterium]
MIHRLFRHLMLAPDADPAANPRAAADGVPGAMRAQRVPPELYLAAAVRLVSQSLPDREVAARRLLANASEHGIDFANTFATIDHAQPRLIDRVRQVCLLVPGSGRTAMMFVSEPNPTSVAGGGGDAGGNSIAYAERVACVRAACEHAEREMAATVRLFQALPEPGDTWLIGAYRGAGFLQISELEYLRRPRHWARRVSGRAVPSNVHFVSVADLAEHVRDAALLAALDRTYADTLDCPELCGMRDTRDVLDSHLHTGHYDPRLWTIAMLDGEPHGCLLLSRVPEQRSCELVYLGISPSLRGKGVASALLARGLELPIGDGIDSITCAVDGRNTPAKTLYDRFGFRPFGRRIALVKPSGAADPLAAAMG